MLEPSGDVQGDRTLLHPPTQPLGQAQGSQHTLRDLGTVVVPEQSSPGEGRLGMAEMCGQGAGRAALPHTCLASSREQSPRGSWKCCVSGLNSMGSDGQWAGPDALALSGVLLPA